MLVGAMRPPEVGVDSNCFTYAIEALERVQEPTDAIADQRVALVRLFHYRRETFILTPTVEQEYARIRDDRRREAHRSWHSVHFDTRPISDPVAVARRVAELRAFHGDTDCQVLAEAEDMGLGALVSLDAKFVTRLGLRARLKLTRPADYWRSLAIPRGATPAWEPTPDNPLAGQTWWRW